MLNVDVCLRLYIISNVGFHSSGNPVLNTSRQIYDRPFLKRRRVHDQQVYWPMQYLVGTNGILLTTAGTAFFLTSTWIDVPTLLKPASTQPMATFSLRQGEGHPLVTSPKIKWAGNNICYCFRQFRISSFFQETLYPVAMHFDL